VAENDINEQEHSESDEIFADLDDLDKALIRVKLEKPAISNVELAEMYEVSAHKIGRRLKKEKLVKFLNEMQKEAIDILVGLQAQSARYLGKVVQDDNEITVNRIRAAREILKGVLSENVNINMFSEESQKKLQEIREKYADSGKME
jgi:DNA-binding Lrp family transcriptional regulator